MFFRRRGLRRPWITIENAKKQVVLFGEEEPFVNKRFFLPEPLLSQKRYRINALPRDPAGRRVSLPSPGGACGGLGLSSFFFRWMAASARRAVPVARRKLRASIAELRQGAGTWQPLTLGGFHLPPSIPYPALGQPLLAGSVPPQAQPASFCCRASYGIVLPLSRTRDERPGGVGASLLRAMTRLRQHAEWRARGRTDSPLSAWHGNQQ